MMTFDKLFLLLFDLSIAYVWVFPALLLMRFITPKEIVERYFKQPHFNLGETMLLSHFPGSLIRTLIFISACFNPRYRKGRQLDGYLDMVPTWYVRAAKLFAFLSLTHAAILALLFIGLFLYMNLYL